MMKIFEHFILFLSVSFVNSEKLFQNGSDFMYTWSTSNFSLFPTLPIAVPSSRNEQCREDSRKLIANLRNKTFWAMQMWDSSATSSFGVLHGNVHHFGNFDECLEIKVPVKAQYCSVKIKAHIFDPNSYNNDPYELDPNPTASVWQKFRDSNIDRSKTTREEAFWGLCVPASCDVEELQYGLDEYLNSLNVKQSEINGTTYTAEVLKEFCENGDEPDLSAGEIAFWIVCAILISTVVITTAMDFQMTEEEIQKESKKKRALMSFSAKRNILNMFSVDEETQSSELQMLYGLKCFTIVFITYDHRVVTFYGAAMFNRQKVEESLRDVHKFFLPHGDLLVDTFFFVGGLLCCYLLLDAMKRKFSYPLLIILARYVRLGPLYFFIVWFHASALLRFGSGPGWRYGLEPEAQYCQKNWWANVLFIQNYVNSNEMCMIHAWYLPCDIHFFIMAIFIVMLIKKNKKIGLYMLGAVTFISIIIPGIITYIHELKPMVIFYHDFLTKPREDKTFQLLYIKSHTRATVYLLGIITGYILYTNRGSTKKISYRTSIIGCFVGLGLLFAPMAYGSLYYDPRREYSVIESSIFASLRRTSWGLAFVVFLLINRFGTIPIVGQIFEWKIAVPLSKVAYSVYLIHFVMQMADQAKVKIPYQFIIYDMFVRGTNDLVFAVGYSLVLYLIVELPFRLIFKELIFSRAVGKPKENGRLQEVVSNNQAEAPKVFSIKL